MPHLRNRFLLGQISAKAKLWPVLGLLGPRQVGKSTLLREICGDDRYINLDLKQLRDEAAKAPDFFVESHRQPKGLTAIDEVQKAPELFDAVKASVDGKRRPGVFILAGSTEFSSKVGIRESLTGRIGLLRVWPLTLAEMSQRKKPMDSFLRRTPSPNSSPAEIIRRMELGGMPGWCFTRNAVERDALIDGWLETTCYRDIDQIIGLNIRGDKVRLALTLLAQSPDLTVSEAARSLRVSTPTARKIFEGLETLMVVTRIMPHPKGTGKERWLICDSAVARYLGASRRTVEQIVLHQEIVCQYSFAGLPVPVVSYYRNSRGTLVDFIVEDKKGELAVLLVDTASPKPYDLRALSSLTMKIPKLVPWVIGPFSNLSKTEKGINVVPWTCVI
jgi:predicted AAA+ superfamily ATPase